MSNSKIWQYWEVNRGRYLCDDHGGFGDGADGYAKACPLCPADGTKTWQPNSVSRALHIINGLQNRSKRNVALVSAVSGGLAGLGLLAKLFPEEQTSNLFSQGWFFLSILTLLISIVFYGLSMRQVPVTKDGCAFLKFNLSEFLSYLAGETAKFEKWHKIAGLAVGFAVIFFAVSLIWPHLEGAYSAYLYKRMTTGASQ